MNLYTKLSFNIIAIFVILIAMSFVPEYLHEFFGDTLCQGKTYVEGKIINGIYEPGYYTGCRFQFPGGVHDPKLHWGYRHWMWFFMGILLFIVQCVRVIETIITATKK